MFKYSLKSIWLPSLTVFLGGSLGIWLGSTSERSEDLYFANVPDSPPAITLGENLFDEKSRFIESSEKIQRVGERDGETEAVSLKFYCPQEALQWGELVVRWEWDADWAPSLGILEPNLMIVPTFDPAARAEIYVSSEGTQGRWILLTRLEKRLDNSELNRAIDVTQWVQKGNYLRVKYRVKAEKFMTHPTPDDPIGFAGAQCLRQLKVKPTSTRLMLWR
jgi:hypothetical protein